MCCQCLKWYARNSTLGSWNELSKTKYERGSQVQSLQTGSVLLVLKLLLPVELEWGGVWLLRGEMGWETEPPQADGAVAHGNQDFCPPSKHKHTDHSQNSTVSMSWKRVSSHLSWETKWSISESNRNEVEVSLPLTDEVYAEQKSCCAMRMEPEELVLNRKREEAPSHLWHKPEGGTEGQRRFFPIWLDGHPWWRSATRLSGGIKDSAHGITRGSHWEGTRKKRIVFC